MLSPRGVKVLSSPLDGRGGAVVRIVVAGDSGTGKTSLVLAAGAFKVQDNLNKYFDNVPITIIDTYSRGVEDSDRVSEELQRADLVILTYACDRPITLVNLSSRWLPLLHKLEVKVPVIVVGCKVDLQDENQYVIIEQMVSPLMHNFCQIESFIECSAYSSTEVIGVFFLALKAAIYPIAPLFDKQSETLTPRCKRALKLIFILCDHDKDGALSDCELDGFQVKCFDTRLIPLDVFVIKKVVQEHLSGGGVNERGLTLTGFLFIHALFIQQGSPETVWTVLRKFGYNDDIKLTDDFIPHLKRAPDQSVELTNEATDFLKTIFDEYDGDFDKVLQPRELEELFSTAPESPWIENPYKDAVERNEFGGLSLDAFLSEWALMTLLNPTFSVENLIYIGYPGDPSSAIRVTRMRHIDCEKQHSERNVLQCFIFGPGKSKLWNSEAYNPTNEDHYAVKVVDISGENKKYLVLRDISEGGVSKLLAKEESLASCDIAVFVYDRSDESSSWKALFELLLKIVGHGEHTGFQVPCLIVEANDNQDSFTILRQIVIAAEHPHLSIPKNEAGKTHKQYKVRGVVEAVNNIFRRIATTAEHLRLSITKIEAEKICKQYPRLTDPSLMFGVGLGVVVTAEMVAAWKNGVS